MMLNSVSVKVSMGKVVQTLNFEKEFFKVMKWLEHPSAEVFMI